MSYCKVTGLTCEHALVTYHLGESVKLALICTGKCICNSWREVSKDAHLCGTGRKKQSKARSPSKPVVYTRQQGETDLCFPPLT